MKQLKTKTWNFSDKVNLPVVEKQRRFLFWKWTSSHTPSVYKYGSKTELFNAVNNFIADNKIENVVSFEDTARIVKCINRDYGCSDDDIWYENDGSIKIVYMEETA